jgi:uncharacterized protein YjaZ
MHFQIVDTESAYRRLLDAPDAAAREAIFREELIEPFMGLVRIFGGDEMAVFAQWGMAPDQFAGESRDEMAALIDALAEAEAWTRAEEALNEGDQAFAAYPERIPLEEIVFGLYLADLSGTAQVRGYTGFGGIPGWIMTVYGTADEYNLQRVEAATVHELHHNVQGALYPRRANMMQVTVGEYVVNEGLAESFATELYGADVAGPWVTDLDDSDFERVKPLFKAGLNVTGFNEVGRYIFGDPDAGLPVYAGYAVGYRVVQAYLRRSGKGVVEATFVPAEEIIAGSGFFD